MIQFAHAGAYGPSSERIADRAETRNLSEKRAAFHGRQTKATPLVSRSAQARNQKSEVIPSERNSS